MMTKEGVMIQLGVDQLWLSDEEAKNVSRQLKDYFNSTDETQEQADRIYAIYPRKKQRGRAIPAIKKAIRREGFDKINKRTALYAAAVGTWKPEDLGPKMCYVPYPASWFNGEEYNDDPDTWYKSGRPVSHKRPSIEEILDESE